MAGQLVSSGVQNLWDLLSQEYAQFKGVDDQVAELKSDLNLLNSFLRDADAKKHSSAMVRNCMEEIKVVIFDAEDIIETFLLKEKLGKTSGIKKHIKRLACVIPDRREIALDIGVISKRISKLISVMQSFGIQQIVADGCYTEPLQDRQREMRQEFARDNEKILVGLEENVKKLVGHLVEEDDAQVVSLTGMGGLGKSTLARQAFNHDKVKKKFDKVVWVCVSQVCDRMNVWQAILRTLRPEDMEEKILEMTEATLHEKLFELLGTSKSLVVFDDIWKEEDWDLIKPIFPDKAGWKVLLTSRNESVAGRGEKYISFKPDCLSDNESWTLFQRIAMPRKDAFELKKVDEEMEEMGKQMIEHCEGLPLAVKVLGGLLAEKYTPRDWKRISENIGSHLLGRTGFNKMNKKVDHVLSLSFEELPSYLKNCFLYLAHFPEDYEINIEDLSYFWAAEGILMYDNGETIRDVGDGYIEELVRRNMVISKIDNTTLRFETCSLHDKIREICLSKAKEENFLQFVGIRSPAQQSLSTSRRYVSQYPDTLDVKREINNSKARSLVVIWKNGLTWDLSSISFTRLQLLRELHLPGAKFKGGKLSNSIGKLIHLRYLNLKGAVVSHLPSLQNLKLLIYLNLDVYGDSISMPNVLMGMTELRYLALPKSMRKKTKLELSNLVNLETLKNFSTENSSLKDLCGMARLRTLAIRLTGESNIENLSASIGGLRYLENLVIGYDGARGTKEWGTLLDFSNLKQLHLRIDSRLLPDKLQFPSRLTSLTLFLCRLEEDPMPILEKLLHLKELTFDYKSFSGRRMVCSRDGFPQLQKLVLLGLDELEEWIVEEGSMPLLHILEINSCMKLKELPGGLRFITSLKDLIVCVMGEEWKERLSDGGEDYYKVQHIPSVRFLKESNTSLQLDSKEAKNTQTTHQTNLI